MNKWQSIFFKIILLLAGQMYSSLSPEYIYPIGPVLFEEEEKICTLYQSGTHLELLLWDPITHTVMRGLSHYMPAGLAILPSQQAFSFIDHERIRIKELSKKSPKALDLNPLYDFSILHWIDDSNCYCSARERRHFNLFHITTEGDFYHLTRSSDNHYTYPQKIESMLFYIKKNEQTKQYSIEKTVYPEKEIADTNACIAELSQSDKWSLEKIECANQEINKEFPLNPIEELFVSTQKALSFLTMTSSNNGYFLQHTDHPFSNSADKTMSFECWNLHQNATGRWETTLLFTFAVPLSFLYGEKRLYESILRVTPLYLLEMIFFVTMDALGNLDVYRYKKSDGSMTCCTSMISEHCFFTPILYRDTIICGGMVKPQEEDGTIEPHKHPSIFIDQYGEEKITFYEISNR